jgi:hypothetical protein
VSQYGFDDLDGMTDLGPTVVYGSTCITGLYFDGARDAIRQDPGTGLETQITIAVLGIKAGTLSGIDFEDSITIDGTVYTVRSVGKVGDGTIEEIVVVETTT